VRRFALPAAALLGLAALTGCTHLGPGNDHGAKTSTVVYSVTGAGVTNVSYAATATSTLTRRTDVELPFKITVKTRDHSQTMYKVTATPSQGELACSITVNGVRVYTTKVAAGQPITCSFLK